MNRDLKSEIVLVGAAVVLACAGCRTSGMVARYPVELENGELVIFRLQYGKEYQHKVETKTVPGDYAILIDWIDDSSPRLFFYNRKRSIIEETRSFERFLKVIDRVPAGAKVNWVDTCCAPISYGIGAERSEELERVLRKRGRTLAAGEFLIICTCESKRMLLPGDR